MFAVVYTIPENHPTVFVSTIIPGNTVAKQNASIHNDLNSTFSVGRIKIIYRYTVDDEYGLLTEEKCLILRSIYNILLFINNNMCMRIIIHTRALLSGLRPVQVYNNIKCM